MLEQQATSAAEARTWPLQAPFTADGKSAPTVREAAKGVRQVAKALTRQLHAKTTVEDTDIPARQPSEADAQTRGSRSPAARTELEPHASNFRHMPEVLHSHDQRITAASGKDMQNLRIHSPTPSGSRQASKQTRRRRHFHTESTPPGRTTSDRKRSQTTGFVPNQDAKRSRHDRWQPPSALARHAEHERPAQAEHRYGAHRQLGIVSAKQDSDRLAASRYHKVRASSRQSVSPRSKRHHTVHADIPESQKPFTNQHSASARHLPTSPGHTYSKALSSDDHQVGRKKGCQRDDAQPWQLKDSTESRGSISSMSIAEQPAFQHHQRSSWSHEAYRQPVAQDHRESPEQSVPAALSGWQQPGADGWRSEPLSMSGTHTMIKAPQLHSAHVVLEATVTSRAQKLHLELDLMIAGLANAYQHPKEDVGSRKLLDKMSIALKLTEDIDDGSGNTVFTATPQVSFDSLAAAYTQIA